MSVTCIYRCLQFRSLANCYCLRGGKDIGEDWGDSGSEGDGGGDGDNDGGEGEAGREVVSWGMIVCVFVIDNPAMWTDSHCHLARFLLYELF